METTGFTEKESFETISRIIIAVLMVLQALVIGAAGIRFPDDAPRLAVCQHRYAYHRPCDK